MAVRPEPEPRRSGLLYGPPGFFLSMMLPAVIAVIGIAVEGFGAIEWLGAIVWGVVATVVFTMLGMAGKAMGMTRMDLLDLLGSFLARPGTGAARAAGAMIHHTNGALLAVAWAYGALLVGWEPEWWNAVLWGVILWVLALWMMSAMGSVHPAIRRGEQEDPGPAMRNYGPMTPVGSLMNHLIYGLVLGIAYDAWPLC